MKDKNIARINGENFKITLPRKEVSFVGKFWNNFKRFGKWLKKDTWQSLVVTLIIAFIVIQFLFLRGLP